MVKIYRGDRTIDGVSVTVDGQPLSYRTDLKRIADDDFEWSYEGDAPNQLALALLADHLGDQTALKLHDAFMREVVANFSNEWEMTSDDIDAAVQAINARAA